jgi:alpha-ketoglutarate-dependent 2,4-dichlorophenoxyacetate dioxygenase
MPIAFKLLHAFIGAEVSGVDIRQPLTPANVVAIEEGMNRYAVLVFRDQPLSQGEQVAFSRNFGPLDQGLRKATGAATRFEYDELIDVSNLTLDGKVAQRDDAKLIGTLANQLWHSDSSFQTFVAKYSMLSGVTVPGEGGDTEFADLRAAYDALDAATKRLIEGLSAEHYAFHSRTLLLGDDGYNQKQLTAMPPVEWPLVRVHPGSGRKLLFVGIHCRRVTGMTLPEGRLLLAELLEHATQREFVYRHTWRAGDLVMWDNRATLHRGRRYDLSQRRDLRRTTTVDVASVG